MYCPGHCVVLLFFDPQRSGETQDEVDLEDSNIYLMDKIIPVLRFDKSLCSVLCSSM